MGQYEITAPDGHVYRLEGPDNASEQDLISAVQQSPEYLGTQQGASVLGQMKDFAQKVVPALSPMSAVLGSPKESLAGIKAGLQGTELPSGTGPAGEITKAGVQAIPYAVGATVPELTAPLLGETATGAAIAKNLPSVVKVAKNLVSGISGSGLEQVMNKVTGGEVTSPTEKMGIAGLFSVGAGALGDALGVAAKRFPYINEYLTDIPAPAIERAFARIDKNPNIVPNWFINSPNARTNNELSGRLAIKDSIDTMSNLRESLGQQWEKELNNLQKVIKSNLGTKGKIGIPSVNITDEASKILSSEGISSDVSGDLLKKELGPLYDVINNINQKKFITIDEAISLKHRLNSMMGVQKGATPVVLGDAGQRAAASILEGISNSVNNYAEQFKYKPFLNIGKSMSNFFSDYKNIIPILKVPNLTNEGLNTGYDNATSYFNSGGIRTSDLRKLMYDFGEYKGSPSIQKYSKTLNTHLENLLDLIASRAYVGNDLATRFASRERMAPSYIQNIMRLIASEILGPITKASPLVTQFVPAKGSFNTAIPAFGAYVGSRSVPKVPSLSRKE